MFPTRPRFYAGRPPTDPSEFPPLSSSLSAPRSAEQAERYFRRVAKDNILPSRAHRWLSLGGWILGGVASTYMVLFADFGDKEHVFSPVRRQFDAYTHSIFNLSDSEKSLMGVNFNDPVRKKDAAAAAAGTVGEGGASLKASLDGSSPPKLV